MYKNKIKKKAVTLIEVIVVISILAVMSSVTIINFSLVPARRVQVAAQKLAADLRRARAMSLHTDSDYCVYVDVDEKYYEIYKGSDTGGVKLKKELLRCPVSAPASDFDLVFVTTDDDAQTLGGSAQSSEFTDHQLQIDLDHPSKERGWRVTVYETFGYVMVEQWKN